MTNTDTNIVHVLQVSFLTDLDLDLNLDLDLLLGSNSNTTNTPLLAGPHPNTLTKAHRPINVYTQYFNRSTHNICIHVPIPQTARIQLVSKLESTSFSSTPILGEHWNIHNCSASPRQSLWCIFFVLASRILRSLSLCTNLPKQKIIHRHFIRHSRTRCTYR